MGKIRPVEVSEQVLEDYIMENPDDVEEDFKVVDKQWPTDSGPLDILGVDGEGILVIIELKAKEDDGQLIQGLRYYDYVASNIASIVKHLENRHIPVSEEEPRLMLIAPSFSRTLVRVAKYVDVDLDLKEYQAFKLPSNEIEIVFKSIEIEERKEPKIYPTLEEKLNIIEKEDMRDLARSFLEELKNLDVS
ncbi:MAG: endonuclease NucS [Nitrososphaerota archaeon]